MTKRLIIEKQHENQNERWMRIHNLKLCKCGVRIPVNQKTCSFCLRWAKLDRNHRQYVKTHGLISLYNKHPKQKRLITIRQEQALQLCHQDFKGLDQAEAAKRMGINQSVLSRLLARVKKILPQYFPIITKLEAQIYHYYMVEGWEVDEITEYTESSPDTIYKTLQRARGKGMFFTSAKGRILSYDASTDDENEGMDAQVVQKF